MQHPGVCSAILSLKIMSPQTKQGNLKKKPKATSKTIIPDEEEEIVPHGMINAEEAKIHALSLENMLDEMEEDIKAGTVENVMKTTIDKIKLAVVKITPLYGRGKGNVSTKGHQRYIMHGIDATRQ